MNTKVPVSERALLARINRKLAKDDKKLCRCKQTSRAYTELGDYYIIDFAANVIIAKHCELDVIARNIEVLADWEELEEC